MDVDLLRPGTVPMSPNTVLWFEFLLDPSLLSKHLQKVNPDPSPSDLIIKFHSAIFGSMKKQIKCPEPNENGDLVTVNEMETCNNNKFSLKVIALKILSLKVAAHLNWSLDNIGTLPFKVQLNLLLDLFYFTSPKRIFVDFEAISSTKFEISELSKEHLFALVTHNRWLITSVINNLLNGNMRINGDIMEFNEENQVLQILERSLEVFLELLDSNAVPVLPTSDCFVMLSETSTDAELDWSKAIKLTAEEFKAQIHYDVATYYFFKQMYPEALKEFNSSLDFLERCQEIKGFCTVDRDQLNSFLIACGSVEEKVTLSKQLDYAINAKNFDKILDIFVEDMKNREIPLVQRVNFEMDLRAQISNGSLNGVEEFLAKISALNAIRCKVEGFTAYKLDVKEGKLDFLVWAASLVWCKLNNFGEKQSVSNYFMQIIIESKGKDLLNALMKQPILEDVFDENVAERLKSIIEVSVDVPDVLKNPFWDIKIPKRNPKLEIRLMEHQLNDCFDTRTIKDLLTKLISKDPNKVNWRISAKSELPIPLQNVISAIPKGFLQDFSYVMLAKSRSLMLSKDWATSILFLETLQKEIQVETTTILSKLSKLTSWEILLVRIAQLFEENHNCPNQQKLIQSCESALKNNESGIIPRTEVMEQCVLYLLSVERWDFLVNLNKPWSFVEIVSGIASVCQVVKFMTIKVGTKELWDLVIPCFAANSSNQTKRNSSGGVIQRDSSTINNSKLQLVTIFSKLRDFTSFDVVISLLARLYNLLKDDGNIEVSVMHIDLWPSNISNPGSFSLTAVMETLTNLVQQGLKYYRENLPWLQLMADLCFSTNKYENALKYYLQFLIARTDHFNIPEGSQEHIFRRMIKCCTQLGSHTQAAVLCQFLDPPDYTLAFRSLVDFKSCNDAVEAYYHCFWDTNILEYLVHLHHKRGEVQRKKKAIQTIGLLELNSNNNEEIQREAINQRKRTFMNALCKQYVR